MLEALRELDRTVDERTLRDHLALFLFCGDDVDKPVTELSGGEKQRLSLARMTRAQFDLLCLDEPTNHLDVAGTEGLEQALKEFPGTVVRDHARPPSSCDEVADRVAWVESGRIRTFDQGLDAVPAGARRRARAARSAETEARDKAQKKAEAADPTPVPKKAIETGKVRNPLMFQKLEERIMTLEADLDDVRAAMLLPENYGSVGKIKELQARGKPSKTELAAAPTSSGRTGSSGALGQLPRYFDAVSAEAVRRASVTSRGQAAFATRCSAIRAPRAGGPAAAARGRAGTWRCVVLVEFERSPVISSAAARSPRQNAPCQGCSAAAADSAARCNAASKCCDRGFGAAARRQHAAELQVRTTVPGSRRSASPYACSASLALPSRSWQSPVRTSGVHHPAIAPQHLFTAASASATRPISRRSPPAYAIAGRRHCGAFSASRTRHALGQLQPLAWSATVTIRVNVPISSADFLPKPDVLRRSMRIGRIVVTVVVVVSIDNVVPAGNGSGCSHW